MVMVPIQNRSLSPTTHGRRRVGYAQARVGQRERERERESVCVCVCACVSFSSSSPPSVQCSTREEGEEKT